MCLGRAAVDDHDSPPPILRERLDDSVDGEIAHLGFVRVEYEISQGISEAFVLFGRPDGFKDKTRLANPGGPNHPNDPAGFGGPFPDRLT